MTEADSTAATKNHELTLPAWDAVSITRQRAEERRIEQDRAVEDLRTSMPDEPILTAFGIDMRQIDG